MTHYIHAVSIRVAVWSEKVLEFFSPKFIIYYVNVSFHLRYLFVNCCASVVFCTETAIRLNPLVFCIVVVVFVPFLIIFWTVAVKFIYRVSSNINI